MIKDITQYYLNVHDKKYNSILIKYSSSVIHVFRLVFATINSRAGLYKNSRELIKIQLRNFLRLLRKLSQKIAPLHVSHDPSVSASRKLDASGRVKVPVG